LAAALEVEVYELFISPTRSERDRVIDALRNAPPATIRRLRRELAAGAAKSGTPNCTLKKDLKT